MKKLFIFLSISLTLLLLTSCGYNNPTNDERPNNSTSEENATHENDQAHNSVTYEEICSQLRKTSMGSTEYAQIKIDEFEQRFVKMNLSEGFKRVNHFRSQEEYAYVIEFENEEDAQIFYDTIGTSNYNIKKFDSVVVYGKSDSIDALE